MGSHTKSKTSDVSSDPVTATLDSIRRIVRMLRVGSRAAEKHVGLSGAQLFVLHALSRQAGQSLNELAERTRTHQSSVSVVVQRLVDRGLVTRERSDGDSRRLELSLTSYGHELLRDAPDAAQNRLINALDRLPAANQSKLASLLSQLVTEMGDGGESPHMFFEEDPAPDRNPAAKKTRKKNART
jgi:MarR family transcriptional regulator, lower aerobic nicotinate degradation pathway regulator